jgi:pSer/pThr/pTyr-binding forkhead associated (FHA) protein
MNEQHFARFEAHLERLIEGVFTQLFGARIQAQDLALQLARAMEEGAKSEGGDPRPIAPDEYIVLLHPQTRAYLVHKRPALHQHLSDYLVELAVGSGYRLNSNPVVEIAEDAVLNSGQVRVRAGYQQKRTSTTALMKRVEVTRQLETPQNPQLVIAGHHTVQLTQSIINIGRSQDNHVVIDDRSVSRHHLQLRLRSGRYILFDTQSRGGTLVNNVLVKQHELQNGDVIRIGDTRMVYMEDRPLPSNPTGIYEPLDPDQIP